MTKPPFEIGKPCVRQPRCDTRVTPEEKRLYFERKTAEIAERRAIFDATAADANNNNNL